MIKIRLPFLGGGAQVLLRLMFVCLVGVLAEFG